MKVAGVARADQRLFSSIMRLLSSAKITIAVSKLMLMVNFSENMEDEASLR